MRQLFLVGIGGGLGAVARYTLGGLLLHPAAGWKFPLGTFAVNVSGCLAAGVLAGLAEKHGTFSPELRLFVFTGFLGGYTTFSAFGLETLHLLQRHETPTALANAVLSVLFGVLALWLGVKAAS